MDIYKQELKSWLVTFGKIFSVFILFVTITSWLRHAFDWPLLPVFENTISMFRVFTSLVFDTLFYSWLIPIIEYSIYWILVALEPISKIIPYFPQIEISPWVKDAALISAILLRAQTKAMKYSDPLTTLEMSPDDEKEWELAQQVMPATTRIFIRMLWHIVLLLYFVAKIICYPFKIIKILYIKDTVQLLVGGGLMLGLAYFVHDALLTTASRSIETRHSLAHRAFMKALTISLLAALTASLVFFAINGYFIYV